MSKRFLSLLLGLVMCLALFSGTARASEAPVELTICTVRRTTDITTSYAEKHWVQALEKACNVKITWIELLEGSTDEPLTALLAGNLPDIFWAGSILKDDIISQNTSLWHTITEEEMQTHTPNLVKFMDANVDGWRDFLTYPDGNIYGFAGGKMHSRMHTTKGIQYINQTWLDNLGLEMPTTMDEFVEVLRAFRDNDANGNGDPNDEIPFDFCENHYASMLIDFANAWGLPLYSSAKVYYSWDEEGNVVEAVNTQAYREFLEFFHGLGQEGLLNLEGFSQSSDQYNANLNAGKVGVFWGWGPCNYITAPENFLQYEAMVPTPAEGYKTVQYTANLDFANAYRNNFVITRNCKNVEKALEIWEYASDPTTALDICNGEQFFVWDYVDADGNYLGEDATAEEIAACGYNYLSIQYPQETEEEIAAYNQVLTDWGYEWLIDKTFTGSNTIGLVNIAPLMLESEGYRTDDLTKWGVQRFVSLDKFDDVFCPYYMNLNIVPAEKQEEFDFKTDGLVDIIRGFCANSVMNGVTDESWNNYLKDLNTFNYDFYVDFYNQMNHGTL